jgi:ferredoxin
MYGSIDNACTDYCRFMCPVCIHLRVRIWTWLLDYKHLHSSHWDSFTVVLHIDKCLKSYWQKLDENQSMIDKLKVNLVFLNGFSFFLSFFIQNSYSFSLDRHFLRFEVFRTKCRLFTEVKYVCVAVQRVACISCRFCVGICYTRNSKWSPRLEWSRHSQSITSVLPLNTWNTWNFFSIQSLIHMHTYSDS